jgi:tRNA(fMet)-specific endonuclease VapC
LKYVLDTNVVSLLMKGDQNVIDRLRQTTRTDVYLPAPVVAEIAYGISRLPKSKRKEALASRFNLIKAELARAPWTDEVSEAFGAIKATLERKGERIVDFDAAIAAHAMAEDVVLVTANLKHTQRIPGVRIEDWGVAVL